MRHEASKFALFLAVVALGGCAVQRQIKTNALEFLYPAGAPASPATDVSMKLPARVGIVFAPAASAYQGSFTEDQKHLLLARIAGAFRGREGIAGVEVIPTTYLTPQGGFENLDRVAAAFGIDVVALVSYDQFQFSESGTSAWTYWTLVGAYVVKGERHETRTTLETAVFHIASRTMLFQASGTSVDTASSTPIKVERTLREVSQTGFGGATDDLIVKLDVALAAFVEQAKSGRVRGAGTPTIAFVNERGEPVARGGSGAGAFGVVEGSIVTFALLAAVLARRRGRNPA